MEKVIQPKSGEDEGGNEEGEGLNGATAQLCPIICHGLLLVTEM